MRLINKAITATALTTIFLAATATAQAAGTVENEISDLRKKLEELEAKLEKQSEKSSGSPVKVKWEPAPSISSPDGKFEMNLRGRIYVDTAWINDQQDNENTQATEFRTARLGIEGKAWKDVKYKFEADFAGNEVDVKDAYIQWKGPLAVKVGQFKTPNSLEEQTSSRYITFMERASFTDAFSLARQIGLGLGTSGKDYTVNVGIFRGANATDDEDEGLTFAGRVTYGPKMGDTQLHLGASFRHQNKGDDQSSIRYRQRPHAHLAQNRYIDTGRFADKDTFFGFEAAGVMGPISLQGEWAFVKANIKTPTTGENDPTFNGGYIEASYMLTGESRAYKGSKGSFQRIKVNNPVFEGGMGAWQVAARFDRIDLTDETFFGGEQDTFLVGLNWYLNRHTRFMMNYSHANIKNATDVSKNDVNGKNKVDTIGFRAQVDW
ncbi:OprO/OprP family phosphate-selective porin [Paremcibacter congregatus]|uniref:Porin n=1 Tax=Paremcibacter congregatus TaxID=2043170 RepID=A0A2G4YTP8_9PROT|nr:OprO/OprP family phosphate-selective porin [Paremcibacter congregatus]PHZ85709.1 hypothetical protein CRD36_03215 [Paremcibacter congregatus]QDE26672.1 hypothetical protein FIV45_04975 [Paremcibacter congregatus]